MPSNLQLTRISYGNTCEDEHSTSKSITCCTSPLLIETQDDVSLSTLLFRRAVHVSYTLPSPSYEIVFHRLHVDHVLLATRNAGHLGTRNLCKKLYFLIQELKQISKLRHGLDPVSLINLEQSSKLIKFPTPTPPLIPEKCGISHTGSPPSKSVQKFSLKESELPCKLVDPEDPEHALLRNGDGSPCQVDSCYLLTASSEINSRPLTSILDLLDHEQAKLEVGDTLLEVESTESSNTELVFTADKRVDKKVKLVSTSFPEDCYVHRCMPEDPLLTLPSLPHHPPEFKPTYKIANERMEILNVNGNQFLLPEEEKLFKHIMVLNEQAIAFEDAERRTLKDSYFPPYIIPTVPHVPWEYKNIPIAPGLREQVMEVLKLKIEAGVYEQSQSSYRSQWFVVQKKNGKLRIVHDLQPLNKIAIRDAGTLPVLDEFVENFGGHQCYTVFDLFWGFDARKIHPKSRDLTAFMTPLGLLQIISLPTGFTNSPAEFQKCMTIVLQDEIPNTADIFIDDLPIKGPESQYLDSEGKPEVLKENPGIRHFIWEHANDVHRIMHRIKCAGATFAANKAQICRPEVLIVGQICNAEGQSPDNTKVDKILSWPPLTTLKQVRQFLGLCGTVRIWIQNYSKLVRSLTELYRQGVDFVWDKCRQDAFDEMKTLISSTPALRRINYRSDNPVVLSVDSSKEAVGFILSQLAEDGKTKQPARYGSLPMSPAESHYSQPKLELFGLYHALHEWEKYLLGVKNLIVEVDAKYIKGML